MENCNDFNILSSSTNFEPKLVQPLVLALVGDSVESLKLREWFAKNSDLKVNAITKKINTMVNAHSQAESLRLVEKDLSPDEIEIVMRARNTHTHSTAKNYSVIDYRFATAFEALLGYLYLSKKEERLNLILNKVCTFFLVNGKN